MSSSRPTDVQEAPEGAPEPGAEQPQLSVRTRKVADGRGLLELLPPESALSWVCRGEGIVGWGEAARLEIAGPQRFTQAEQWWQALCSTMSVHDDVRFPGTGPVAFVSFAFAAEPGHSVIVVPEVIVGQRAGVRWVTQISRRPGSGGAAPSSAPAACGEEALSPEKVLTAAARRAEAKPPHSPGAVAYQSGQHSAEDYRAAVDQAIAHMRSSSEVHKVVLAHDLLATTESPVDNRFVLANLAREYPDCWTFAVDGLVGATPELLLERTGERLRSRVLAGTSWPRNGHSSAELRERLLQSAKDRAEHAYAVESLTSRLAEFCTDMHVPEEPDVLRLRNVLHLATDIAAELPAADLALSCEPASLLRIAEAVHPTAAVGGTPTPDAVALIAELEGMDRGRYAGPVGWIDADGNGELGLALRCADIQERQVRLFAGGGIVSDSDPDLEVHEAQAKLVPIKSALEQHPPRTSAEQRPHEQG